MSHSKTIVDETLASDDGISSPGSAPALDRALDILELLSASREGLTLSELSEQLQLPKNSVFRLTQTLLARGYLARNSESLAFQLTGRLLKLAPPRWSGYSLPVVSRDSMIALRDQTRETVQLGVLSGLEGVIIDQVEGLEPLRIAVDLGLRFALHNNAPGKLLLAFLPPAQRTSIMAKIKMPSTTPRTITTKNELLEECNRIIDQGYATDFAESDEGIHCIAGPIYDANQKVVGALWVTGPAKRLPKSSFRELGMQVMKASHRVSRIIGELG
jgi:DNA-binding IclR family transcriptional regulator